MSLPPLISLLRISLGIDPPMLRSPLSDEQWREVASQAKKQAVLGMVSKAMLSLPQEQMPPKPIKIKIALYAERIGEKNSRLTENAARLFDIFAAERLESCVLKGQGVASLYPDPLMRQSGDIDIWVKGDYRTTIKALKKYWKIGKVFYHHVDIKPFDDKTEVEVHFRPSWLNSPFNNIKIQKWFKDNAPSQFENYDNNLGFAKPRDSFNCVYGAIHIYRHLLQEGIGLRQITDYFLILNSAARDEILQATEKLNYFGLNKFLPALMYVLQTIYSLPKEKLLTEPNTQTGEFLLEEILRSGNFGRSDDRYTYDASKGPLRRFVMRMSRLRHYYCLAPSEVLWAPVFKGWQWSWKAINRF